MLAADFARSLADCREASMGRPWRVKIDRNFRLKWMDSRAPMA
jgi:hypothetical protein